MTSKYKLNPFNDVLKPKQRKTKGNKLKLAPNLEGKMASCGACCTWVNVSEHLPTEHGSNGKRKYVLAYSSIFGEYVLANFNPALGWVSTKNSRYEAITHWCDMDLYFPFECLTGFNDDEAEKYGYIR